MRIGKVERIVLGIVLVGGLVTLAVVAPNTLQLLKYTPLIQKRRKYYIDAAVTRLINKGLLETVIRKDCEFVQLTESGRRQISDADFTASIEEFASTKQWDRKWRILIFDIPEVQKRKRNSLREHMIESGFVRLQHSVWIIPYDCSTFVALLKVELGLTDQLRLIIAESIENDALLRRHFRLPT